LLPRTSRLQLTQQPLNERFASEEKCGVVDIENAQAAIGTLAFVDSSSGTCSGLNSTDAGNESVKCILVIKRIAKFDPGGGDQKSRQTAALSPLRPRQQNGNHPKTLVAISNAAINRRAHLFVLPRANPSWTNKDRACFRFSQRVFNC
jgi:hypothetical protein